MKASCATTDCAGADDPEPRGQQPVAMQGIEGGPQHAPREVAGGAEEHQRAAIDAGFSRRSGVARLFRESAHGRGIDHGSE
jgi:hypothetical protein